MQVDASPSQDIQLFISLFIPYIAGHFLAKYKTTPGAFSLL
jgi:hypothetical protein